MKLKDYFLSEKEEMKLFKFFKENKDEWARKRLVLSRQPVVNYMAAKFTRKGVLSFRDLVQEGNFGLFDAIDKYNFEKGAKFRTYSEIRVKGAMLDALVREFRRGVFGISRNQYPNLISLSNPIFQDEEGPKIEDTFFKSHDYAKNNDYKKIISILEDELNFIEKERDKSIVCLIQNKILADSKIDIKEIGKKFELHESRISQIWGEHKKRLKENPNLREMYENF